jgi:hypothetical protein
MDKNPTLRIPGFTAETSLCKTNGRYRLIGALVQADGVTAQVPYALCGPCYLDNMAACVQTCTLWRFPHLSYTVPCDPSNCLVETCDIQCSQLKNKCARLECLCECEGGTAEPVPHRPPCNFVCT